MLDFARNHDVSPLMSESIANCFDKNQMSTIVRFDKNTTRIMADIVKNSRLERNRYVDRRFRSLAAGASDGEFAAEFLDAFLLLDQ